MKMINKITLFILLLCLIILSLFWIRSTKHNHPSKVFLLNVNERPNTIDLLFDYASLFEFQNESVSRYLKGIRNNFHIEAIIITIPSLKDSLSSINELAATIASNWQIGKSYNNRGLLLLFVDDIKEVRLEVSYELEDVFTDLFCGYVEDKQLRPNFLNGSLENGLIAVMEELEYRAQLKYTQDYNSKFIATLDSKFQTGGAGAVRRLSKYKHEQRAKDSATFFTKGAETPAKAWEIMLSKWRGEGKHKDTDIYTEATKLAMGNQNSKIIESGVDLKDKAFKVYQSGNYAVISFGLKEGWNNSPFLFVKTDAPEGWKFDIVHQRKYVVMSTAPYWSVERADHPYVELVSYAWMNMGKDIPLESVDRYHPEEDVLIAQRIVSLEIIYKEDPNNFEVAMELGRLGTILCRRSNHVYPYLKQAKKLKPQSPLPYKYTAIFTVESQFQYKTALEEMKVFIQRTPESRFGRNFLGYLHFQLGQYGDAISEFNKALKMQKLDSQFLLYAYCKLSRCNGMLFNNSSKVTLKRKKYREEAIEFYNKAYRLSKNNFRVQLLGSWLLQNKIISN